MILELGEYDLKYGSLHLVIPTCLILYQIRLWVQFQLIFAIFVKRSLTYTCDLQWSWQSFVMGVIFLIFLLTTRHIVSLSQPNIHFASHNYVE